jgi:hypothetical protein
VSNPVALKILQIFYHLQEATLSTPTWAEFETALLLKIVSKVSIALTFAGEGSSLTEHQEVTSPTQRHEEKEIDHRESTTKYPEVSLSRKVSKNKWDQHWKQIEKKTGHLSLVRVVLFIAS